jgi:predicted phage terminase large subunit-like protein
MAGLKALSRVERERLLHGNWKVRSAAGMFYRREWFKVVDAPPADAKRIRFWDRAATEPRPGTDPDWTGGVKVSRDKTGIFYVEHVIRMQRSAYHVDQAILNAAAQDGSSVTVGIYKDPGSAGKGEAEATARRLAPFVVFIESTSNDKQTRAKNSSSQAEAGNICIVRGGWNEAFLSELENFPEGAHDDQVDPFASGVNWLSSARKILVA